MKAIYGSKKFGTQHYVMAVFSVVTLVKLPVSYCHNATEETEEQHIPHQKRLRNVPISHEKRLIMDLLDNYFIVGNNGRPVINDSTSVPVQFGLGLIQMDLNERYKVLKMSMWSRYRWRDEYLQWDPEKYGGVKTIRLKPGVIWVPDIMLYNTADPNDKPRDVLAVISYDGAVLWVPHQIFKSSCSIDVVNFPFDEQTCHMWFGTWTHNRQEVDVNLAFQEGIDLSTFQSDYKESSEWDIYNTIAEKKIMPNENDSVNYAVLTFQLDMRRKLVFSSYILTLPCVFLACLTLVVFWLPPDRPDRTSLAMSISASFLLLLLILVEAAPPTASSVPVLGVYYCFNLVIIMLAIFLSSLVVNVCKAAEGKPPVPQWVNFIFITVLARIMFMRKSLVSLQMKSKRLEGDASSQPTSSNCQNRRSRKWWQKNSSNTSRLDEINNTQLTRNGMPVANMQCSNCNTDEGRIARASECAISSENQVLIESERRPLGDPFFHQNSRHCNIIRRWRDVGRVMDRFFFVVYLMFIIGSLAFLFPRPNHSVNTSRNPTS